MKVPNIGKFRMQRHIGTIEIVMETDMKFANNKLYVVKQVTHNLLGVLHITALGLLTRVRRWGAFLSVGSVSD